MSSLLQASTVSSAVRAVAVALKAAGVEDAGLDARLLVAAAIDGDTSDLIRAPERALSAGEAEALATMMRRRCAREPVSRILGWREFFGRRFAITPGVLDPRADSETAVEVALEICQAEGWTRRPVRLLDLGTGSGCLLVSLLAELPLATGVGLDISPGALDVARRNAAAHGVAGRAQFLAGDMTAFDVGGFEMVVSNPPYIRTGDIAGLAREVAAFDPGIALDGGPDGLSFYRGLLAAARRSRLVADAPHWVVLEAGQGQSHEIRDIASSFGLIEHEERWMERRDLGGVTRCVAIRTRS